MIEKQRRRRTLGQWSLAWGFAVVLHELLPPILLSEAFESGRFVAFTLYFGIISYLFTWLYLFLPSWLVTMLIFVFGGVVETFFFGTFPNPLLAGALYLLMLALPFWLAKRIWKTDSNPS
jgi:hypothetical protein